MSNRQLVGSRIVLGLFLAALIGVLGLSGCGSGNGGTDPSTSADSVQDAASAVAAAPSTQDYTSNFDLTEDSISEGGVWRRASNVGTNVRTANGIAFGTNGSTDTYDDSYALLSGFGPDQQAQAVVFRSPSLVSTDTTHEMELLLRFSDDADNARGYECLFNYARRRGHRQAERSNRKLYASDPYRWRRQSRQRPGQRRRNKGDYRRQRHQHLHQRCAQSPSHRFDFCQRTARHRVLYEASWRQCQCGFWDDELHGIRVDHC